MTDIMEFELERSATGDRLRVYSDGDRYRIEVFNQWNTNGGGIVTNYAATNVQLEGLRDFLNDKFPPTTRQGASKGREEERG